MFQLKGLSCPCCSQLYPTSKSLSFHINTCLSKHIHELKANNIQDTDIEHIIQQEMQLPQKKTDHGAFNEWSAAFYQEYVMQQCEECGRRYNLEAFLRHPCRKGKSGVVKKLPRRAESSLGGGSGGATLSKSVKRTASPSKRRVAPTTPKQHDGLNDSLSPSNGSFTSRLLTPVGDDEFVESPKQKQRSQENTRAPPLRPAPQKHVTPPEEPQLSSSSTHLKMPSPKHLSASRGTSSRSPNRAPRSPKTPQLVNGKPAAFTCHLCGREFGTSSFAIHLPQCAEKVKKHQEALPKFLHKPLPDAPRIELPQKGDPYFLEKLNEYNQEAQHIYQQVSLSRCPQCKRTFKAESLLVHMRSCCPDQLQANTATDPLKRITKAPKTLTCHLCCKQFLNASIQFHIPKCEEAWLNNQKVLPQEYQRHSLPAPPTASIKNREEYNEQANYIYMQNSRVACKGCSRKFEPDSFLTHLKTCSGARNSTASYESALSKLDRAPKTIVCYCCGKQFGSQSITIHQKQCFEKREKMLADIPPHLRRPLKAPSQPLPLTSSGKISTKRLQSYNDEASMVFNSVSLFPCENCGRTFRLDALRVHQRSCRKPE